MKHLLIRNPAVIALKETFLKRTLFRGFFIQIIFLNVPWIKPD